MIKLIVLSVLLNPEYNKEFHYYSLPYDTKIEARRRGGKQQKGRKRGGNGLR
jgi:hypothetical protein